MASAGQFKAVSPLRHALPPFGVDKWLELIGADKWLEQAIVQNMRFKEPWSQVADMRHGSQAC